MRKRLVIGFAILLAALLGGVVWQVWRPHEPVYQGKPISIWITEGYVPSKLPSSSALRPEKANEAVLACGTNALPYYQKLLEGGDDSPLKVGICAWLNRLPWLKFGFTHTWPHSRRTSRYIGSIGLSILGADAKPAIPALTKLLNDGDETQVRLAAEVLPEIGLEGIRPLTNALSNTKAKYRYIFAVALGRCGENWHPFLKRRPQEENESAARIIVPVLIPYLREHDSDVQVSAMQSLGWIAREPETVVPAMVELLQASGSDMRTRHTAILALENFGTKASNAVPALLKALQDQNSVIRRDATFALKHIDPDAAKAEVQ